MSFPYYLMHGIQLPLLAASSPHLAYIWNAATVMYLNKHACRQCMHFEIIKNLKPPVARKLPVRHTKCVCLTASFLATGGFIKLFHKIPWFFHDYSGFFFTNSMIFPCMELFSWFSRFSMISRACGNPGKGCLSWCYHTGCKLSQL